MPFDSRVAVDTELHHQLQAMMESIGAIDRALADALSVPGADDGFEAWAVQTRQHLQALDGDLARTWAAARAAGASIPRLPPAT